MNINAILNNYDIPKNNIDLLKSDPQINKNKLMDVLIYISKDANFSKFPKLKKTIRSFFTQNNSLWTNNLLDLIIWIYIFNSDDKNFIIKTILNNNFCIQKNIAEFPEFKFIDKNLENVSLDDLHDILRIIKFICLYDHVNKKFELIYDNNI